MQNKAEQLPALNASGLERIAAFHFSDLRKSCPTIYSILEKELRNAILCRGRPERSLISRVLRIKYVRLIIKNIGISLGMAIRKEIPVLIKLSRFPCLERCLGQQVDKKFINETDAESAISAKVEYFFGKSLSFFFIQLPLVEDFISRGVHEILNDRSQWRRILSAEHKVEREINTLAVCLRRKGVKYLITDGDNTLEARFLALAAKRAHVKIVVFNHGYIANSLLVGIWPTVADFLIVPTHAQRRLLLDLISPMNSRVRVECFGFYLCSDGEFRRSQYPRNKGAILLVLTILCEINTAYINEFRQLKFMCDEEGYDLIVRFHPKDARNKSAKHRFLRKVGIDRHTFQDSEGNDPMKNLCLVIGCFSTLLIQAKWDGVPVFHVALDDGPYIEGVTAGYVSGNTVGSLIEKGRTGSVGVKYFSSEEFLSYII